MDIDKVHIGELLKKVVEDYCEKSGADKMTIASRLGVTPSALSSIFRSPNGSLDNVEKVCAACEGKAWQFMAFVETRIPIKAWSNFERIMNLEEIDKNFVLEGINNSLRFIIEKNKKAID